MVGQKVDTIFDLKRPHLMYINQISALFWLSYFLSFPLIKSVFGISHERLLSLDVLYSNLTQHISMQLLTQRLSLL